MKDATILDLAREILQPENHEKTIREWAEALFAGKGHEIPSLEAYLCLNEIGPRNDWNGERGVAMRLKFEIENAILYKATALLREMRESAEVCAS